MITWVVPLWQSIQTESKHTPSAVQHDFAPDYSPLLPLDLPILVGHKTA